MYDALSPFNALSQVSGERRTGGGVLAHIARRDT